jgi:hypothetical protein
MVRLLFSIFSSKMYSNPGDVDGRDFCLRYTHLFKIDFCWQHISLWINVVEAESMFIIMQKLENVHLELFDFMMWGMWKGINIKVWDNIFEFNQIMCKKANLILDKY